MDSKRGCGCELGWVLDGGGGADPGRDGRERRGLPSASAPASLTEWRLWDGFQKATLPHPALSRLATPAPHAQYPGPLPARERPAGLRWSYCGPSVLRRAVMGRDLRR